VVTPRLQHKVDEWLAASGLQPLTGVQLPSAAIAAGAVSAAAAAEQTAREWVGAVELPGAQKAAHSVRARLVEEQDDGAVTATEPAASHETLAANPWTVAPNLAPDAGTLAPNLARVSSEERELEMLGFI
jgi:hypothetical protein